MADRPLFAQITVIGLGLIGSSIARAAHERKLAKTIVACDRNEISLAFARKNGFIDIAEPDALKSIAGSDLIIIATPPSGLESIAEIIGPGLSPGAIVMDVCSVKQPAIDSIAPHIPPGVYYIPSHPIAGSEHSGVAAGRADLFLRKRVIVTPKDAHEDEALQKITAFWKDMGALVEAMPAHLHDLIYAYVSHLPQLLAFAAATLLDHENDDESLQKFLRIGGSDPELWIDIFLMNRGNLLKALDRYLDVVAHILGELAAAPADEPPTLTDEKLARTALFPRIAASCLVTTVMEAEKQAGFSFARYTGGGFADFTYPVSQPPEEDIEHISKQYRAVASVLRAYTVRLQNFRAVIESGSGHLAVS